MIREKITLKNNYVKITCCTGARPYILLCKIYTTESNYTSTSLASITHFTAPCDPSVPVNPGGYGGEAVSPFLEVNAELLVPTHVRHLLRRRGHTQPFGYQPSLSRPVSLQRKWISSRSTRQQQQQTTTGYDAALSVGDGHFGFYACD